MILSLTPLPESFIHYVQQETGERITLFTEGDDTSDYISETGILIVNGGSDRFNKLKKELLSENSNIKWIYSFSAGVDQLQVKELADRGVLVTNAKGVHAEAVAEYVITMVMLFNRNMHIYFQAQQRAEWIEIVKASELRNKTLCIIGAGTIGKAIAKKAKHLNLNVIGLKKHPEPLEHFDEVWSVDRLHEALRIAHFNVLITPLTKETKYMINRDAIDQMRSDSFFINVSRGDTVVEEDLEKALENKRIAGAALDVFHKEPLPEHSKLWKMENVLITPHIGGSTTDNAERSARLFVKSYRNLKEGKKVPGKIDPQYNY